MHIRCPHYQNPIGIVQDQGLEEIVCPSWGASFRLELQSTAAWSPQQGERLWRWCRRNPAVAALTAAVAFLLIGGTVVSSLFAIRANQFAIEAQQRAEEARVERDRANEQARIAESERNRATENERRAIEEKNRADAKAEEAERNLYAAHMNLAQNAWEDAGVGATLELLDRYRQSDLRGFEWFYWDRLCHSDLLTLKGHTAPVTSVAFSPDGKRLASASQDGTVRVWDATSGQETLTLKGHKDPVTSVVFSPDGRRLASASWDGTVKAWHAATGQETLTLKGHTNELGPERGV